MTLSLAGSAAAAESQNAGVRLRYERRDLFSPATAHRLLQRIGNAALEVCGASSFSLPEVKAATRQSRCWKNSVDDAVRRLDSPLLSVAELTDHSK